MTPERTDHQFGSGNQATPGEPVKTNGHPTTNQSLIQIETFTSFPVNQNQEFYILLHKQCEPSQLSITITNPSLGPIKLESNWSQISSTSATQSPPPLSIKSQKNDTNIFNECRVRFVATMVGIYTVSIEHSKFPQCNTRFISKAYDISKVIIQRSSTNCHIKEPYEFSVDASEAGEGQLEIAVNEGEIPNQVQVLNNGKCIVNFLPEESTPHVVDIKFNGRNVAGCPFIVDILPQTSSVNNEKSILEPSLKASERILIDEVASFQLENLKLPGISDLKDIVVIDPDGHPIKYRLIEDQEKSRYIFDFQPNSVGDHIVDILPKSPLLKSLPISIVQQFPFPLKIFDHKKVIVSDVTDGVVGNPIYFFIDASMAGSGNLEIRVSSTTRNVPNVPQSEANAKIRVSFTPTEPVDHKIDVKFNGLPVLGNPFNIRVAQYPQARLSAGTLEKLKYIDINEDIEFYVDYLNLAQEIKQDSCIVSIVGPDNVQSNLDNIEILRSSDTVNEEKSQTRFKITFRPTKIGPHKLFIKVNNEILTSSPLITNVCNINEVKVIFNQAKISKSDGTTGKQQQQQQVNPSKTDPRPIARLNKPMTFTVDASRAGEGTLALVVLSSLSRNPVQTEVNVSDKKHGLYELTFVPVEFASHSIDMSFNEKCLPNSPFIVDIIDDKGTISSIEEKKPIINKDETNLFLSDKSNNNNNNNNNNTSKSTENDNQANVINKSPGMVDKTKQLAHELDKLNLTKDDDTIKKASKSNKGSITTSSKKSLAYGLVNASNIVYLESGILENNKNQVSLIGPNGQNVPFILARGSPQRGETKKTYIEYKPKDIGTHVINVLENGKDLRQYFVETCDPSLVRVLGLDNQFVSRQPVTFLIDSENSGEIQLDNIYIFGPKNKIKDGENTILSRIKSMSSSSSSSSSSNTSLEYSLTRISNHQQEVSFIPRIPGKHSIHIKCLGQPVGKSPYEIDVKDFSTVSTPNNYMKSSREFSDEEILANIVVHGVSLKCSPVNSTGAFIIETNRFAQAKDFDVLITDPQNSLVDVQCYSQQDGNLLAEWIPRRVGSHKIEVLYKDEQVPNSPFMTEAFDPSGVIIENIHKTTLSVNEKFEFFVNRKLAGHGELDVAISSPVGQDLPIDVKQVTEDEQVGESISFIPPVSGKYKLSILFGGFEVPKSPLILTVKDKDHQHKITGTGIRGAEINRTAQFSIESSSEGQLKVRIECGDREIVPKIEQIGKSYNVKYKPSQIGYATISLYWNGSHIEGSPFAVPINDLSKILFLSGSNRTSNTNNQRIVHYEPGISRDITLDTSKCGPGELVAEAYCRANPTIKFNIPVDQFALNRYKVTFTCPPKNEGLAVNLNQEDISCEATYIIRFYYNNLAVPEQLASVVVSPLEVTSSDSSNIAQSTSSRSMANSLNGIHNDTNNNTSNNNHLTSGRQAPPILKKQNAVTPSIDRDPACPVVTLRGHGLAEARTGELAEFIINGSKAGQGKPEVNLIHPDIGGVQVMLENLEENIYRASYTPDHAGAYTLNVLWDGQQVAGCPLTLNVTNSCDPSRVLCTGDGLKGGILGEQIKVLIDTRRAGSGELTALCTGPSKAAFCELLDRGDGTFILYIKPQEAGRQVLTIKYGGEHIPKSPFMIKVSGKPDPTKVRVHGPGIEHGVLSLYQSRFVCDTRGAGAGQLTVRIRGPKGAFRMETQRENQRDRSILCKYDPTEPGDYRIEIKWSGNHVPGSPFHVMIFDTQEELNRFLSGVSPFYYNYL